MSYASDLQDENLLRILGPIGNAVDVGANDGLFQSNTKLLEEAGWDVLCIEANPLYGPDLWKNRRRSVIGAVGVREGLSSFYIYRGAGPESLPYASWSAIRPVERDPAYIIPVMSHPLDWYLEHSGFVTVDLICADIEGTEEFLLQGLDLKRWKPRAILLECSNDFPKQDLSKLDAFGYRPSGTFGLDVLFRKDV